MSDSNNKEIVTLTNSRNNRKRGKELVLRKRNKSENIEVQLIKNDNILLQKNQNENVVVNMEEVKTSKKKAKLSQDAELNILFQGNTASTLSSTGEALIEAFSNREESDDASVNVLSLIFKNST